MVKKLLFLISLITLNVIIIPTKVQADQHSITLVAIGDSLTYGVGDNNKNGGYVGDIKKEMKQKQKVNVRTINYGVPGERSDQILKRIETKQNIRNTIKKADAITITAGGNDIMQVMKGNPAAMKNDKMQPVISKNEQIFQNNILKIFTEIHKINPDVPVYMFSIYNPFYVYFPNLKKMQVYTDQWNNLSKQTINQQEKVYFVDVNKKLSEGQYYHREKKNILNESKTDLDSIENKKLKDIVESNSSDAKNQFLSSDDNFHPNNKGYEYMSNKLYERMKDTKNEWK